MRTVSNLVLKLVGTRFVRVAGHVIDRDECSASRPLTGPASSCGAETCGL